MITIQESLESYFRNINTVDIDLQRDLLKGRCVNCKECPKEGDKIDYVVCSSGVIQLWHYRDEVTDTSCAIIS